MVQVPHPAACLCACARSHMISDKTRTTLPCYNAGREVRRIAVGEGWGKRKVQPGLRVRWDIGNREALGHYSNLKKVAKKLKVWKRQSK